MSITRILVGVDGSAANKIAVQWAAVLASKTGASVVAVHAVSNPEWPEVSPIPPEPFFADHPDVWRREVEMALVGPWTAPLRGLGDRLTTQMVDGYPPWALLESASESGADLVVVGKRGLGGFPELLLGSVSSNVVYRATTPVAIVRESGGGLPLGLQTILVGVDGSAGSTGAAEWTGQVARQLGAKVIVASVLAVDSDAPVGSRATLLDHVEARLTLTADALRNLGIDCRTVAAEGPPAPTLMALADQAPADLLVVGSRGLGGVRSRMLGSVGYQLVHHVDRPLVVVRPPRRHSKASDDPA